MPKVRLKAGAKPHSRREKGVTKHYNAGDTFSATETEALNLRDRVEMVEEKKPGRPKKEVEPTQEKTESE